MSTPRNLPFERSAAHGATIYKDRTAFLTDLREVDRAADVRLTAPELKAVLGALGKRDETAEICSDREGNPESDPELRDTESVPLRRASSLASGFGKPVWPGEFMTQWSYVRSWLNAERCPSRLQRRRLPLGKSRRTMSTCSRSWRELTGVRIQSVQVTTRCGRCFGTSLGQA
jgi:hypothetical protein